MTYQVSEDGITIEVSDDILVSPDKKKPTPDDDGVIMYYELLNPIDSKNIYWREKLGESMKKSFREVTFPKGKKEITYFFVITQAFLLIYQKKNKAILTDFPKGYKLYAHRKKYPKKEERTDYYLFGIIPFL
jgi:hypothetical protein